MMKMSAVAGKRARTMTNVASKESLIAILPILLTARASLAGLHPFGIAAFAALMPSPVGIIALAAGSISLGISGIKYILCGLIYYGLCYIKRIDRLIGAVSVFLIVSFASAFEVLFLEPKLISFIASVSEGACAGVLYYIFASLRMSERGHIKPRESKERISAQLIILGAVATSFSGIVISSWIDVGLFLALIFSMLISGSVELTKGITAAAVLAFIYMISGTATHSAVSIFVTSALFTALLSEAGKWGVVLGYFVGSAVVLIANDLAYDVRMYIGAIFGAVAVYAIIPQSVLDMIGEKVRDFGDVYDYRQENNRIEKKIKNIIKEHTNISASLRRISDELKEKESSEKVALYSVTTAVAQRADTRSGISGDCCMSFEADGGRMCTILCDGMGSGKRAYRKSLMTAELLREFLRAGFLKEKAVGMLNSLIAMRGEEESFSTVDLFEFNTFTGDAVFLKIGSAESFIKHKGEVEVLSSSGLPVGILEDVTVAPKTKRLNTGDIVVMISDGIGEAGYGVIKSEWIKRMIKSSGADIAKLTDDILAEAVRRNNTDKDDDMTVIALRIERAREAEE